MKRLWVGDMCISRALITAITPVSCDLMGQSACVQAFTEEQRAELHAVEAQIRRRIAIGSTVSERKLKVSSCYYAAPGTS